ncbi:MAG: 3-deoxy-manno-octulosonate cytidylyltransferase [Candidatus Omnitrophica bacterium]|nr:3-deoxy-manno-octulosonate cytidylyltransferase [Candidatus Omnitrophota bacterium]
MPVRVAAVIPARMASHRFPGKPLLSIRGLPLVEHVRRRATLCGRFSEVVVATCDPEIAQVVEGYGGRCLMTSSAHPAATDRVAEAARQLDCTHVVNVQGDEVLVLASDLARMVRAIETEPEVPAWNAVTTIEQASELSDSAIVKCVVSMSGRILYCLRDGSSLAMKLGPAYEPIRTVVGILGYTRTFLEQYTVLARTPLEVAEGIDQSRILEHDILLRAVEFSRGYPAINEPREVELVRQYLAEDPVQQAVLDQVLQR